MPEKKSLYQEFVEGIGHAIVDIREKVVEEPWFGRVVNDRNVTELNWGWPQPVEAQPEPEKEPEHDRDTDGGIDR